MNVGEDQRLLELTPSMCEACVLGQRKKKIRKTTMFCVFIAYNAIVLLFLLIAMWCMFDFRDRLKHTEDAVDTLSRRDGNAGIPLHEPMPYELSMLKPENIKSERNKRDSDTSTERIRKRMKRAEKKRKKKRCKNCLPVVQIEGAGGVHSNTKKTDLSYLWVTASWMPSMSKINKKSFDVSSVVKKGRIKILEDGLYLLYAQMNMLGPSIKGFEVFKEESNSAPECITSCRRNSNLKFTENCFTLKAVRLKRNSTVYIQEMETNGLAQYLSKSTFFGLMTLRGLKQRGYHVKKSPHKTTIASCVTYDDGPVGISEDQAKYLIRSCPTLKVVRLEKKDELYIEEIDDNSEVLYSGSVFGLIRIST